MDVLNKLFDSENVNRIVSIPLSQFARMDELVWRGDNTRVYSAKSGYKWLMLQNDDTTTNDATNQNSMLKAFYKKLWTLDVATKVRRTTAVSYCPICRRAEESVEHMFSKCLVYNQILQELEVPFSSSNRTNGWKLWLAQEFVNNNLGTCKV
ncbi:hypothetical protein J1N35_023102 [Gossypium stocksii]|uniref:Reverse transcriptase zinc-binding domain-containing protein n=1 Tax=Gossypium stocksii TaxID=47602 RepID=A0A9D3VID6_9ROSI|nr:hypothetical protein J1N35_023102 [Gossypium stocksii]